MIDSLELKPDFAEAAKHFESWWLCQNTDRPIVSCSVRPVQDPILPPAPPTLKEQWLDPDYTVAVADAKLSSRPWIAESFPVLHPNVGPDLTATLFGCDLKFGENTSWVQHSFHSPDDWAPFLATEPEFENLYWQTIETCMGVSLERGHGRFLTGLPDLHGAFDMLAGIRSPEGVCLDLYDAPDQVLRSGLHAARAYDKAYRRAYRILERADQGSTTWCPLWHSGPAYVSSCDFLALVSSEIAKSHILPTIRIETSFTDRSIFHLDGPDAHRHLDLILNLDTVQAVQWVYGDGAGPATRWIDTYRRILETGRAAQVICETAGDAVEMAAHLGSAGIWLTIYEELATESEANDLIAEITKAAQGN